MAKALPSPTPKEQEEPIERASSNKPKTQKINQLLRQVYEMEVLEEELKRNNETLTSRNKLLHKSYLEQRERYIFLKMMNTRYLKDNTRLYRMVRLQRMQLKESKENPTNHVILSTLAKVAISLQPLEASQGAVNTPSTKLVEEES